MTNKIDWKTWFKNCKMTETWGSSFSEIAGLDTEQQYQAFKSRLLDETYKLRSDEIEPFDTICEHEWEVAMETLPDAIDRKLDDPLNFNVGIRNFIKCRKCGDTMESGE